jgi:hypothetical protein
LRAQKQSTAVVDGNMVVAVWLRARGFHLKDVAHALGCSIAWAHYLLKRAERILNPPYVPEYTAETLRVADLPLPPFLKTILAQQDIVMARELAAIPVNRIGLIPNMGCTRMGRLYLTLLPYGLEFHPSWRMTIDGARFDRKFRKWRYRTEPDVRKERGVWLLPYSRR